MGCFVGKAIFVTGGSGFIGKYVVQNLLEKKEKVIVLVRDKPKYAAQGDEIVVEGNLGELAPWKETLKQHSIGACIHLAWEGIPDYSYEMSKKNLVYGLHVLDLCKEFGIGNLVITGSCWEYKEPKGRISVNHPVTYEKPFQAAKNSLRMMAHAFCKEQGIRFHWLRLFYVYGPGQREGALIPYIIKCFKEGKQPELKGAYNKNDFVYVEDVAEAIVESVRKCDFPELVNVGSGASTQVSDIVKMVAKCTGSKFVASTQQRAVDNHTDFYVDTIELRQVFPCRAFVGMEQGIRETLGTCAGKWGSKH